LLNPRTSRTRCNRPASLPQLKSPGRESVGNILQPGKDSAFTTRKGRRAAPALPVPTLSMLPDKRQFRGFRLNLTPTMADRGILDMSRCPTNDLCRPYVQRAARLACTMSALHRCSCIVPVLHGAYQI
jgi:hypothetical protein